MSASASSSNRFRFITITIEDRQGVLQRVFNLISRRGFHLESCSIISSHETGTITMQALIDPGLQPPEQIERQLNRLIDVVQVVDHTDNHKVKWSSVLVKLSHQNHGPVLNSIPSNCISTITHSSPEHIILAVHGNEAELNSAIRRLRNMGVPYLTSSLTMPIS